MPYNKISPLHVGTFPTLKSQCSYLGGTGHQNPGSLHLLAHGRGKR